jgi:hypothetical protein
MGDEIVEHSLPLRLAEAGVLPEVIGEGIDDPLPGPLREELRREDHVTAAALLLDHRVRDRRDALVSIRGDHGEDDCQHRQRCLDVHVRLPFHCPSM